LLKIFYRRFYILLFLVWLVATAGLFVLSVWGDFGTFVTDFKEIVRVGGEEDELVLATKDTVAQATDKALHKAQVARDVVRKKVSGEVHAVEEAVEEGVEKVFKVKVHVSGDDQVEKIVEHKAQSILKQARQHKGAGKLAAISFTEKGDQLVAHLKTSKSVGKVTRFWLDNPTRLVVDLRGDWKNATSRVSRFADSFMYRVIIGMHPDRLRVVFKFEDSKAPAGELPELIYTDDGLDIVVENPAK